MRSRSKITLFVTRARSFGVVRALVLFAVLDMCARGKEHVTRDEQTYKICGRKQSS